MSAIPISRPPGIVTLEEVTTESAHTEQTEPHFVVCVGMEANQREGHSEAAADHTGRVEGIPADCREDGLLHVSLSVFSHIALKSSAVR